MTRGLEPLVRNMFDMLKDAGSNPEQEIPSSVVRKLSTRHEQSDVIVEQQNAAPRAQETPEEMSKKQEAAAK